MWGLHGHMAKERTLGRSKAKGTKEPMESQESEIFCLGGYVFPNLGGIALLPLANDWFLSLTGSKLLPNISWPHAHVPIFPCFQSLPPGSGKLPLSGEAAQMSGLECLAFLCLLSYH